MKYIGLMIAGLLATTATITAQSKTENVVIVTLDGMRWQEVFGGVDSALMNDKTFTRGAKEMKEKYWNDDGAARREKLFPFLWSTVKKEGLLFGNRPEGSLMNVANRYRFSYPGYNEIFTGYPDTAVNSNDKIRNPNENVLEFINKQPGYKGKVAAFSTWDVFPYILNTWRSGVYVNADVDTLKFNTPAFQVLNDMQFLTTRPIGVRPDVITYMAGREYLKTYKPRVLYIAFDETDDFAHGGEYDQYIGAAHAEDGMLADLWKTLQADLQYRNKTTLLITCDHGRGDKVKATWRDHGQKIEDADQIWMAAMGPSIAVKGDIKNGGQLYQKQLAATIAALLGLKFTANHEVAPAITTFINK